MKPLYHALKGKKVLVTGGAGFIGSHLVECLVNYGAQVTVLDNLSSGSLHNLLNCMQYIHFIDGDINQYATCLEASAHQEFIFHLAAEVSVATAEDNPTTCLQTNVGGTQNMLMAAAHHKITRFIFSSSAAVYGNYEGLCNEDAPLKPISVYGTSKLVGELLCKQMYLNVGLETVCLRYFNVYGERQNPAGSYAAVAAKFTDALTKNKPITIFGDGLQTRDFIHVSEVVQANILCALANTSLVTGHVFNIATGNSITIRQLLAQLQQQFPHYQQPLTFAPARTGDIKHSHADCTKYYALKNIVR